MKSPSRSRSRAGFTLLETLLAASIGVVVLGLVAGAYLGANKAKAMTVGGSLLKTAGTQAMSDLYKGLHQNKHLFNRGAIADSFLARLPLDPYDRTPRALTPGVTLEDLRLPEIRPTPVFAANDATGSPNPDYDAEATGNALFYATTEPTAVLDGGSDFRAAFGTPTVSLAVVRLHFVFLARRALPPGGRVRGDDPYAYQLMHFTSAPYLDHREVIDWLRTVKTSTLADRNGTVDRHLDGLATNYAGAVALDAASGDEAFFLLAASSTRRGLQSAGTARIREGTFRTPLSYLMTAGFGLPMVAFNTKAASPNPGVAAGGLVVPAFAGDATTRPYGLEVLIGGPPDGRQVLVRLALAAKTVPGNVMIGESFQQVVQVFDY